MKDRDEERWINPWCKLEPHPGADRLLVVFSHLDERKGLFSLYGSCKDIPAHRLFVNAPNNCWYHEGIPGLGPSIEQAADALACLAASVRPRLVLTLGCSMGGYAALLFGALLGADATLAFCAETVLKLPESRSYNCMRDRYPPTPYDDLLPVLAARPGTARVSLVSGEADLIDLHCADRIRHLPGTDVRTLCGVDHNVAQALHRHGTFRPLLQGFVRDLGLPPGRLVLEGDILSAGGAVQDLFEGRCLHRAGRHDDAVARLRDCLAKHPGTVLAYDELGLIAARQGRHDEAERFHRRALALGPELGVPHHNFGLFLNDRRRYGEAEAVLRRALDLVKHPMFRVTLGISLVRQGRLDEAEESLRAALAANPRLAVAHHHLGLIAAERLDHAAAETAQRQAIGIVPRNASFHYRLALALAAQGRQEEAVESLEAAVALDPRNVTLTRELGRMGSARALVA